MTFAKHLTSGIAAGAVLAAALSIVFAGASEPDRPYAPPAVVALHGGDGAAVAPSAGRPAP